MKGIKWSCKFCSSIFDNEPEWRSHLNAKHRSEDILNIRHHVFKCKFCYKLFKSGAELNSHIDSYHKWSCTFCFEKFETHKSWTLHVKHCENQGFKLSCVLCSRKCKTEQQLKNHMNSVHKRPAKTKGIIKWSCKFCPSVFESEPEWRSHLNAKHRSEDFLKRLETAVKCQLCKMRFPTVSKLNEHQKEKHYKSIVGKVSKEVNIEPTSDPLDTTMTSTDPQDIDYQWPCPFCKKKFLIEDQWMDHLKALHPNEHRIHVKPKTWKWRCFECPEGGRAFKSEINFKQHKLNKHPKWTCEYCPKKKFKKKQGLVVHLKVKHNVQKKSKKSVDKKPVVEQIDTIDIKQEFIVETVEIKVDPDAMLPPKEVLKWPCKFCHAKFSDEQDWRSHLNTHR